MLTFLVDLVSDLLDHTGDDHGDAREAYRDAWRQARRDAGPHTLDVLRDALVVRSVPGARAAGTPSADDDRVVPWLDAWRDGLGPRAAARRTRRLGPSR